MKTYIYDPNNTYYCDPNTFVDTWSASKIGCFWIEATLQEVYCYIFNGAEDIVSGDKQCLRLIDNPEDHPNFYFWVAKDLSRLWQSFSVFPYSGMNSMKENYIYFKPIEIKSLDELKYLDIERLKNEK